MNTRSLKFGAVILAAVAVAQSCLAQAPAAPPAPAAGATGAMVPAAPNPTQGPIMTTLRTQWESVRNKVIAIAEIIPEDKYDYRPTPDVRTFREILIHLAGEGYSFMGSVGKVEGVTPPTNAALNLLKSRDEVMKALRDSYDYGTKIISNLSEEKATEMVAGRGGRGAMSPRWSGILGQIIDNMDHYGNLVTYVRLNGLVPPATAARGGRAGGGAPGAAPGSGGPGGPSPAVAPKANP